MLTWLGLLGRCLHMSMFALAHELPLSPLQIHVNLVLNPALCYMSAREPLSLPAPRLAHIAAGLESSPAPPGARLGRASTGTHLPQAGRRAWHGIHHQTLTAHSLLCFSSCFWSCQFSRYFFLMMRSPAPGIIWFCDHPSFHEKEVFSCPDEIHREMRTWSFTAQNNALYIISKHYSNVICKVFGTQL